MPLSYLSISKFRQNIRQVVWFDGAKPSEESGAIQGARLKDHRHRGDAEAIVG